MRIILVSIGLLLVTWNGALGCGVGNGAPTRQNFKKLTNCVNSLESENAKLKTEVAGLTATLNQVRTDLSNLIAAVNQMHKANTLVAARKTEKDIPENGAWGGMNGTIDLNDTTYVQCPPGSWVSGIQGYKIPSGVGGITGSVEPMSAVRYSCRSLK